MDGERLSLYFQLESGTNADLEIVSSAAIAWVETVRAFAQAIDPESDVRIRLVDVDHSSAVYNTILDWFDRHTEPYLARFEKGAGKAPRTKRLLLGIVPFLLITGVPTWDYYFGEDEKFTDEDRELLKRAASDPAVETAKRKFYRACEREPKITAVGIREEPKGPNIALVPSNQFPEAGGLWAAEEEDGQEQVTRAVIEVVLVKPALVHKPRAWTFKPLGLPEFEAVMRDPIVLRALESGGLPDRMREGIPMTIRIETREKMVDGQWQQVRGGRSVLRVISPKID